MFRHKNNSPTSAPVIPTTKEESLSGHFEGERDRDPSSAKASLGMTNKASAADKPEPSLKELIEKNLKWSQIIYEQNRKINSKLLWAGIFGWFKLILIVGPIILAIIYLQPMLKGVWTQYNQLLGGGAAEQGTSDRSSLESFFQLFNLDPAKQEQLKALLK